MPVSVSKARRRPARPKNRDIPDYSRRSIKFISSVAQEQYNNALAANGVPGMLYTKLSAGRSCSCEALNLNPITEDGILEELTIPHGDSKRPRPHRHRVFPQFSLSPMGIQNPVCRPPTPGPLSKLTIPHGDSKLCQPGPGGISGRALTIPHGDSKRLGHPLERFPGYNSLSPMGIQNVKMSQAEIAEALVSLSPMGIQN